MVANDVVESPAIVAGGGAHEAFAAARLKDWAHTHKSPTTTCNSTITQKH